MITLVSHSGGLLGRVLLRGRESRPDLVIETGTQTSLCLGLSSSRETFSEQYSLGGATTIWRGEGTFSFCFAASGGQ